MITLRFVCAPTPAANKRISAALKMSLKRIFWKGSFEAVCSFFSDGYGPEQLLGICRRLCTRSWTRHQVDKHFVELREIKFLRNIDEIFAQSRLRAGNPHER